MDITVRSLRRDVPSDIEAGQHIRAAADVHEVPDVPPRGLAAFTGDLHYPYPEYRNEYWLAEVDGVPAGMLELELPLIENLDNAGVELYVHPDHQRRGVGRALFDFACEYARDLGRKRLQSESVEALPGGPARVGGGTAFARAMGAHSALPTVRRRLDLAGRAPDLDDLLATATAHSTGYSLVQWENVAPEEYVADLAELDSSFVELVPLGDLSIEPEKVDVARLRSGEAVIRLRGQRRFHTAARHDATNRLVGWTTIGFDTDEYTCGWQANTLVTPAHRGHRLGLLVKIENLRYTMSHVPAMSQVNTWNAVANAHMIAINELMGFRPVDAWHDWELEL